MAVPARFRLKREKVLDKLMTVLKKSNEQAEACFYGAASC